ncbi:type II secretion system F family protein [Citrobacter sp. Marseille-Q6884]|uniref:type II secretion system F family protein n=1 Tax=Citrobacter sp. Marseille-Q6884 TaxID=2956786 RepID=UPI0021B42AA2|nr:type II secretion system F family protein [Citrobacter sp. Marseille-Q6884]
MMIIIISTIILILGATQIYFALKRSNEIKSKILATNIIATRENDEKGNALRDLLEVIKGKIKKAHSNLIGKNRELVPVHTGVIVVVSCALLYVNSEFLQFNNLIVLVIGIISTIYILYMRQVKKSRRDFERDFSEALNIINSSVRVGRPVMQGFEECAQRINSDFGQEFRRILMRLDIGDDPERVFMEAYKRYPYSEFFSFVITVLINMKGGGQVSEVMSRLTQLISASKTLDRKKIAMTAEARMSVKVLVIIPVFFFFFLKFLAPENFEILVGTDAGRYILYYAVGSILFGLFLVWSMMNKVG